MKTFFIADTHFGNENIIKFANRPFKSANEMKEIIIKNWNSVVDKEDKVFVVGDFFDDISNIEEVLNDLNGKIVLIIGNHDLKFIDEYKKLGVEVCEYPIIVDNFYILSHEPIYVTENMPYANIFGHVHNNPNYRDYSSNGFCVSIERINYTPISFEDIKNKIINYKNKK